MQVAAGNEHSVLLTEDGRVYTAGYNDNGQCGQGSTLRVSELSIVNELKGTFIEQVHAYNGCEHTLCVSRDGYLYSFGYNYRGQLGHSSTSSVSIPKLVRGIGGPKQRVNIVSCSYYHTVVVCEDGAAFSFGRNDFGQLGLGDATDRKEPTRIESLRMHTVSSVACGQYHTMFVVDGGRVMGCGKNDYGQLGLESLDPVRRPVSTSPFSKRMVGEGDDEAKNANAHAIQQICCGYYHTLALSANGTVWSFGRNDYGQLGLGHTVQKVYAPQLVSGLESKGIHKVSAGCYHSVAVARSGDLFVFGRNNHGQLGTGR